MKIVSTQASEQLTRLIAVLVKKGLAQQVATTPDGNPVWGLTKLGEEIAARDSNILNILEEN